MPLTNMQRINFRRIALIRLAHLCLIVAGHLTRVTAQSQVVTSPNYRITHLSVEDGLSQSTVSSIVQDAQGFLWFSTADGLDKYDGNEFVVYKHDRDVPNSPPSDDLTALGTSHGNLIWIGSTTGLFRYDKRSDAFAVARVQTAHGETEPQTQVNCIAPDSSGNLWVGTQAGLSIALSDSSKRVTARSQKVLGLLASQRSIDAICTDRNGGMWFGADGELVYISPESDTKKIVNSQGARIDVNDIFEDSHGIMWFGTRDALVYRYDPKANEASGKWKLFPVMMPAAKSQFGNRVSSIAEDHTGQIWIGTRLGGLFRIGAVQSGAVPYPIPIAGERFEGVRSIFVDRSGLVWVGYDGAGIVKINPEPKQIHHFLLSSSRSSAQDGENFLKPILADHRGRWWLGTYDLGLTMINRQTGVRTHFVHEPQKAWSLPTNHLVTLGEDLRGRIWIGLASGIARWEEGTNRFQKYNSLITPRDSISDGDVWAFCFDSIGGIWAGAGNGLLRFDSASNTFHLVFRTDSLRWNAMESLAAAPDSTLWLGTAKTGLIHVDSHFHVIEKFGTFNPGTLCDNFVKSILLEPNGDLWVGTTEGLSFREGRTKTWHSYHRKDGLPDEMIYGVVPAGGNKYWFSTNRGLVRMDATNIIHPKFRTYSPDDGLQSYEFNTNCYFKSPIGEFMFGGINGLNYFYPDSVVDNPHSPAVVITRFKKFDQPVALGSAIEIDSSITLDYSESVFSFEFAALEYTNPARNSYSYQLEGYDRNWIECGNRREARYTNLNPGTYVFRVRGKNNDGIASVRDASVVITIVPPFWRTLWFFSLAFIFSAGAFGGTVRYISVRKMRKRLDQLERDKIMEQHRRETRESIARDLHDDVSSTLSSMALYVESSRLRTRPDAAEAETILERLQSMARQAEDAMEQAVWSLSPHHQCLSHLLARIHDVAIEICSQNSIDCMVTLPSIEADIVLPDLLRKNCFLIFKESLTNSMKHAHPHHFSLVVEYTEGMLSFTMKDDGSGFDRKTLATPSRGGNGLRNMESRADEIGGTLSVSSEENRGTTITLSIELAQLRY